MSDEWRHQIVEDAAESSEYPRPDEAECDEECAAVWDRFDEAAYRALQRWVDIHPGELVRGEDVDSLWDDEGPFLIYMTLARHGVGIWDGSWDEHFKDDSVIDKSLMPYLRGELSRKYQDLETAIYNAAYETAGGEEGEGPPSEEEIYESVVIRDMYTSSRGTYYQVWNEGHMIEQVKDWDDAIREANIWMSKNEYWPGLYYINERGNIDLLDKDGNIIQSWT